MTKEQKKAHANKYQAPLKKRVDIEYFLINHVRSGVPYQPRSWQGDGSYWFCFNVKMYNLDLSFEKLLAARFPDPKKQPSQQYIDTCRAIYNERHVNTESLCDEAIRCAREDYTDKPITAFDGTEINCKIGFLGRSGGWLVLTEFEGVNMDGFGEDDIRGLDYPALRRLYKLIVTLSAELKGNEPEKAVTWHAASIFFDCDCADVEG